MSVGEKMKIQDRLRVWATLEGGVVMTGDQLRSLARTIDAAEAATVSWGEAEARCQAALTAAQAHRRAGRAYFCAGGLCFLAALGVVLWTM